MAKFLHKLGLIAFKNPWWVVASWVVVLGVVGGTAAHFMKAPSSEITIPGIEAQTAIDRTSELFPSNGKSSGQIVFAANGNATIVGERDAIESLIRDVAKTDGVVSVTSPFDSPENLISSDGKIAYAVVQFKNEIGRIDPETLSSLQDRITQSRSSKLDIESGGAMIEQMPSDILGPGEIGGVLLALLVLVVTLGSLIASGMPIVVALVGVAVSTALLFSFSQLFTINTTTPVLGVMLGLAVGIDYSLFVVNKYRTLLREGYSNKDAAGHALATAGNAVVFAAVTVVIALAALSIIGIPFMTMMGLAGAGSVAVAALVALTLLPALFGIFGNRVFTRKMRLDVEHAQKTKIPLGHDSRVNVWRTIGQKITRWPWLVLVLSVCLVAVIALPVKDLAMGLPSDQFQSKEKTERKAYDLISQGFGVGYNAPLAVVVEDIPKVSDADIAQMQAKVKAEADKKVAAERKAQEAKFAEMAKSATTPEAQMELQQQMMLAQQKGQEQLQELQKTIEKTARDTAKYVQLIKIADRVGALDNVEKVLPAAVLDDGTAGILQVIPKTSPNDKATADLIATLRSAETKSEVTAENGATIAVSGVTALQGDINQKLSAALPQYLAIVVGLSLIVLVIAFRSILVPIKATLGFLLSVAAMFGAMVAIFQWGWFGIAEAPGPIVSFIPIIAVGVLFGLAMDYEFFLVSSMQEAYHRTGNAKKAVVDGFGAGSRVVTAAGIIMVSVFAGFIFNGDATIQPIGFGLAFGVLIDAFLVRMIIVPAVMKLLGTAAWWIPKWLDKLLPHVSIEGEIDQKR